MASERWKQVEALFEAAQQQPPDQRAEFLRKACPDDPELCAGVESLLRAAERGDRTAVTPSRPPAGQPFALKPGTKLANFEIVALIGTGGMGEVYRARDLRLKREVAIKILPPDFAGTRDRIARFEREARAASALNHPNIVSVYDIGQEGGVSFIVSELVDGETLAVISQRGALPPRKLIDVGTQICEGLAAAHAAGVIHRDLKPGNIMLTRDGRVKIVDFGLARREAPPSGAESTSDSTTVEASHPGMIVGTPRYMSPEQVRGEGADARSDLFSLGVLLYEMASGKRAFGGSSSMEVMSSILKDEPPELPEALPPALDRIVRRCIEKEPSRRFQSAADLGFALHSLAQPPKRDERPQRRRWLPWAALLAIAATAGTAYWLGVHPRRASSPPEPTLRLLTNDSGETHSAAISPDGKLVAYASDRANPDGLDIWVQQADGSGQIRITDGPVSDDPAFSADGTQIAFRSEREGGGIYVAPSLGGEARELVPGARRPRFSPDGRWLMYYTGPLIVGDWRQTKLFVRALSGGASTQIGTGIPAGCGVVETTPAWSPDGSRILFLSECTGEDVLTAWVSTVDGKELKSNRALHPRDVDETAIYQWIADPPRLLSREKVGDATYVMALPISADGASVAGTPQRLASVTDDITRVSAALDGRMALSVSDSKTHIWSLPVDRKGQATGLPKQLTYGPASEWAPSISRDGEKVAFVSTRATEARLFYKDLGTGREKELSTAGASYDSPVFNPDGTGIICTERPNPSSWRSFLIYTRISGGLAQKIWDKSVGATPWDWSPDGKTLLFWTRTDFSNKPMPGVIRELDLETQSALSFLADPELDAWQGHFSNDGRWVTFNATTKDRKSSHIYVAPFRKAAVPRSEWIPITQGNWDDKPRFSHDDKVIYFMSGLDGPRRVMAQKLTADMRPEGDPFVVYPSGQSQRSDVSFDEIAAGPNLLAFSKSEVKGNVWLLEPAKGAR